MNEVLKHFTIVVKHGKNIFFTNGFEAKFACFRSYLLKFTQEL